MARFACTLCGDCCTGGQVIRLTGGDLRLLAVRLDLSSVAELRSRGLVSLVRETVGDGFVWRPRMRFRSHPVRQCPFLVNEVEDGVYRGLCSLHPDFKPLVCSLSPLAREVDDPGSGPVNETWSVVAPVEGCPGMGQGEFLEAAAPRDLRERLAEEVGWMRRLLAAAPECPDEDSAWAWLASGVPVP